MKVGEKYRGKAISHNLCYESKEVIMRGVYWVLVLCYGCWVEGEKAEDIPIVCEFKDVFPEELLGLPSQRKINFEIDLILGTQPISKFPYCVALTMLGELKIQLDELL